MPLNGKRGMEEAKKRLKVYCETSFWSYLNGGRTPLSRIAVKQAFTRQWWQDIAPSCEIYVSQYVEDEATDASHIATATVYGMDVLLTWNCRHMANPVTLPKTVSVIRDAGYPMSNNHNT